MSHTIRFETEKINRISKITTVMQHLHAVVDEVGEDFIYRARTSNDRTMLSGNSCLYVYEGKPDCIVGKILHRMGVPLDVLSSHEGSPATQLCRYLDEDDFDTSPLSDDVVRILSVAQDSQDHGITYGNVRKHAESFAFDYIRSILNS
jgi:hypothetical protein